MSFYFFLVRINFIIQFQPHHYLTHQYRSHIHAAPTSLEQAAIATIRKYRPPQAMYAVGNEDVEQVKADMEQRLVRNDIRKK